MTSAPDWALDPDIFTTRFIETWQKSESSMMVWRVFNWLSWSDLDRFRLRINAALEKSGISILQELSPPETAFSFSLDTMEGLVSQGVLQRVVSKDLVELEDYDAVAAMLDAQPTTYDPLDLQHISVGEVGSIRFRAKR